MPRFQMGLGQIIVDTETGMTVCRPPEKHEAAAYALWPENLALILRLLNREEIFVVRLDK